MTVCQEIQLNEIDYYKSSKSENSLGKLNGTYFLWNNIPLNGRIRVSNLKKECGIKDKYIGWISISNIIEEWPEDTYTFKEEKITYNNSIFSICWNYFGSYDNLNYILQDNNLDTFMPPNGTIIKIKVPNKVTKSIKQTLCETKQELKRKIAILFCGQESVGKSTYINKLIESSPFKDDINYISVNKISSEAEKTKDLVRFSDWHKEVIEKVFYNSISNSFLDNREIVCIDYAHCDIKTRKETLDNLKNTNDIDFICVFLNPKIEEIVKRQISRGFVDINNKQKLTEIIKINRAKKLPTEEEFANYGFKSTKVFVIDNSDDINKLDINYLIDYINDIK